MVLGRQNHVPAVLSFLLIASDDGSRLSRNPLQVLLLCVGKTAIMYAKTVQREDCTSVCVCVCVSESVSMYTCAFERERDRERERPHLCMYVCLYVNVTVRMYIFM